MWSSTTISAPVLPAFGDRVPYDAFVVRLDEGAFMVMGAASDAADLHIGDRVELEVVEVEPGLSLPQIKRAMRSTVE